MTIFALLAYLSFATSAKEFFKLPKLIEHYYNHGQENDNYSLLSFLILHYYQETGTDKDAKEDSELPFKTVAENPSTIAVHKPSFSTAIVHNLTVTKTEFSIERKTGMPVEYVHAIWHPPRHC